MTQSQFHYTFINWIPQNRNYKKIIQYLEGILILFFWLFSSIFSFLLIFTTLFVSPFVCKDLCQFFSTCSKAREVYYTKNLIKLFPKTIISSSTIFFITTSSISFSYLPQIVQRGLWKLYFYINYLIHIICCVKMKKKMEKCQPIIYEVRVSEILIFSRHWTKTLYYVFLTCFKLWPVIGVTRSWNELQVVSWSGTVHSHLIVFTGQFCHCTTCNSSTTSAEL